MYTDLWCASFLWGQPGLLTIIGMVERSPCGIVLGKNAARSKLIQATSVGDRWFKRFANFSICFNVGDDIFKVWKTEDSRADDEYNEDLRDPRNPRTEKMERKIHYLTQNSWKWWLGKNFCSIMILINWRKEMVLTPLVIMLHGVGDPLNYTNPSLEKSCFYLKRKAIT